MEKVPLPSPERLNNSVDEADTQEGDSLAQIVPPTSLKGLYFEPKENPSPQEQEVINQALNSQKRLQHPDPMPSSTTDGETIGQVLNDTVQNETGKEARRNRAGKWIAGIFNRFNHRGENPLSPEQARINASHQLQKEQFQNKLPKLKENIKAFFNSNPEDFYTRIPEELGVLRRSIIVVRDKNKGISVRYRTDRTSSKSPLTEVSIDELSDRQITERIHSAVESSEPSRLKRRLDDGVKDYFNLEKKPAGVPLSDKKKFRAFKRDELKSTNKYTILRLEGVIPVKTNNGLFEPPSLYAFINPSNQSDIGYRLGEHDMAIDTTTEFYLNMSEFTPDERIYITSLLDTNPYRDDLVQEKLEEELRKNNPELSIEEVRQEATERRKADTPENFTSKYMIRGTKRSPIARRIKKMFSLRFLG